MGTRKKKSGTSKRKVAATLSRAPASAGTKKIRTKQDVADFFNRARKKK